MPAPDTTRVVQIRPRADTDFDRVRTRVGQRVDTLFGNDVAGDDCDPMAIRRVVARSS